MLTGKTVLLFAATGTIGQAVAEATSRHGATVVVTGRDPRASSALALRIGGQALTCDALDEAAVQTCLEEVRTTHGRVDAVFNAIGLRAEEARYAESSTTLPMDRFRLPLDVIAGSQFLTSRSALGLMQAQAGGSVILLSASLSALYVPFMAGITAACGAVEAITRVLGAEGGPMGVRVNCVRAGAMPSTRTIQETTTRMAVSMGLVEARHRPSPPPAAAALGRALLVSETAELVAWLASDLASGVTGQVMNVCAGTLVSH